MTVLCILASFPRQVGLKPRSAYTGGGELATCIHQKISIIIIIIILIVVIFIIIIIIIIIIFIAIIFIIII